MCIKNLLFFIGFINCIPYTQAEEINSFLSFEDSTYTVDYTFTTTCGKDKLLEIYYQFSHLVKWVKQTNMTFRLLKSGENWYIVQYDYHFFAYKSSTVYKKTIMGEDNLVKFEMINYSSNFDLVPKVISSTGYYRITPQKNQNIVTYYQKTILAQPINWFYLKWVENQTRKFLLDMQDYTKKFEDKVD